MPMAVHSAEPRPRATSSGGEVTTGALAAMSAAALTIATLANPDTIEDGPVVCPFRLMTGLPCPGCGLTRSWVYLAHGQWGDALAANPFGFVTVAAAVALMVSVLFALGRRRPLPSLTPIFRSRGLKAILVAWIGYAVVRLAVLAAGG
jgi:Protein of unknown function (DUF2752)